MEHKCEPANHAINVLHWHGPYLCLIEVFDTNTVHNRSKRPGSLCLLEKKRENTSVTSRKLVLQVTLRVCLRLLELKLQQFRKTEPQFEVATSCCAVVSWCSCSSPSVSAMITLAVPGRNIQAVTFIMIGNLEVGFHTNGLFKSYQSSPGVSARLPSNQKTSSWSDCLKRFHF